MRLTEVEASSPDPDSLCFFFSGASLVELIKRLLGTFDLNIQPENICIMNEKELLQGEAKPTS
jgi:hypothetical protein